MRWWLVQHLYQPPSLNYVCTLQKLLLTLLSSAALRPTSGWIILDPNWITSPACTWKSWNICTSLFTFYTGNASSPRRLMALPPPPPTPITLLRTCAAAVSNENVIHFVHLIKHITDQIFHSVCECSFSFLLLPLGCFFLQAGISEHPLRFNLSQHCTQVSTGRISWKSVADARLQGSMHAAWAIISTSVKLPALQTSNYMGKSWLRIPIWFGTTILHLLPKTSEPILQHQKDRTSINTRNIQQMSSVLLGFCPKMCLIRAEMIPLGTSTHRWLPHGKDRFEQMAI